MSGISVNPQSSRGPAAEVWQNVLRRIPTLFGRLVYLSSLRDSGTGRYMHPVLTRMLGGEDADRALCHSHHRVFSQWLASSLEEQKADLDDYLRMTGGLTDVFRRYRNLAPSTAHEVERQLYLTDLETLLELLRFEQGDGTAIPEPSPHQ